MKKLSILIIVLLLFPLVMLGQEPMKCILYHSKTQKTRAMVAKCENIVIECLANSNKSNIA